MATFGEQTPRALDYTLPPQALDLFVGRDDDASAIAAVVALVPGAAAAPAESRRAHAAPPHRRVSWGGGTEAEQALVRLWPAGTSTHWPLRVAIGEAVGPRCLGRFGNGHVEAWLLYHVPYAPRFPAPDAPGAEGLARALAAVHGFKPPLHVLDVARRNPAVWDEVADLLGAAAAPDVGARFATGWDGASAAYVSLGLSDPALEDRLLGAAPRARARGPSRPPSPP